VGVGVDGGGGGVGLEVCAWLKMYGVVIVRPVAMC